MDDAQHWLFRPPSANAPLIGPLQRALRTAEVRRSAEISAWIFILSIGDPVLVLPSLLDDWPGKTPRPPWPPAKLQGEVIRVELDTLHALDEEEGVERGDPESLVIRVRDDAKVDEGEVPAWVYTWNPRRLSALLSSARAIPTWEAQRHWLLRDEE